jgi:hypothetical protein
LFYDRFQYSISFYLEEATCLRELDHEYIDTMIRRRIHYRDISQQSWLNGKQSIMSRRWKDITNETVANLHAVADVVIDCKADFKLVTSLNTVWIYTNNQSLIKKIDQLGFLKHKSCTEAVINRPKNTIRLKNPQHTNRSYLKISKLTAEQKTQLINFFVNQQEHIRVSPGLSAWCDSAFHRTQDYYFIDHDGESWLVMLSLIHPGLIRKTVELIPG